MVTVCPHCGPPNSEEISNLLSDTRWWWKFGNAGCGDLKEEETGFEERQLEDRRREGSKTLENCHCRERGWWTQPGTVATERTLVRWKVLTSFRYAYAWRFQEELGKQVSRQHSGEHMIEVRIRRTDRQSCSKVSEAWTLSISFPCKEKIFGSLEKVELRKVEGLEQKKSTGELRVQRISLEPSLQDCGYRASETHLIHFLPTMTYSFQIWVMPPKRKTCLGKQFRTQIVSLWCFLLLNGLEFSRPKGHLVSS